MGSLQTRKLTGNKGNVRYNGMEKDGLVALGFTLVGGVFPLSCTKAEVFLLLFNRQLGPFWDQKIVKNKIL